LFYVGGEGKGRLQVEICRGDAPRLKKKRGPGELAEGAYGRRGEEVKRGGIAVFEKLSRICSKQKLKFLCCIGNRKGERGPPEGPVTDFVGGRKERKSQLKPCGYSEIQKPREDWGGR